MRSWNSGFLMRSALLGSLFASVFLFFSSLAWVPSVAASDMAMSDAGPSFSLNGFGTLGLTHANDGNAEFVRDLSQPNGARNGWSAKVDSLIGLQGKILFSAETEAVVQVVSRHHYDGSYDPELTWAFLRHDFSPDFSLRVGRLGTEFYMLGDSRLVGYSNISIRPPPDFYGSLVFSYIDGVDINVVRPLAKGLLSGKLFAGISPEKTPFFPGLDWDLSGSVLVGGYLEYQNDPWQFRLSHARVRFEHETPIDKKFGFPYLSMVPVMKMADQWSCFSSLGLVYDQGPLNVQFMLNRIKQDSPTYENSQAGYILAAYRLGSVTPYLGYSRSLTSSNTLPVSGIPQLDGPHGITNFLINISRIDQHTVTLGSRWDIKKNLALKAQVDWIEGDPDASFLFKFNADNRRWDGNMTVYSLALDFVF